MNYYEVSLVAQYKIHPPLIRKTDNTDTVNMISASILFFLKNHSDTFLDANHQAPIPTATAKEITTAINTIIKSI